jgi:hypothetical protein
MKQTKKGQKTAKNPRKRKTPVKTQKQHKKREKYRAGTAGHSSTISRALGGEGACRTQKKI